MLGPDAFMAEFDGEMLPVAVGLARWVVREKLRDRLGPEDADLDPSNPWAVAQVAAAKEDAYTVRSWAQGVLRDARHGVRGPAPPRLAAVRARHQHVAGAGRRAGFQSRQAGHVQRLLRPQGAGPHADAGPVARRAGRLQPVRLAEEQGLDAAVRARPLRVPDRRHQGEPAAAGEAAEPAPRPQPVVPVPRLRPRPVAAADARSTCSPTTCSGSTSRSPSSSRAATSTARRACSTSRGHRSTSSTWTSTSSPPSCRRGIVERRAEPPAADAATATSRRSGPTRRRCSCATPTRTPPLPSG